MSGKQQPFLPLFFGDFLSATGEWEGEERALYLLLLCYQWSIGSIPAEPRKVCKLVGWSESAFNQCWPTVSTKFKKRGDRLLNQRLEQHREKAQAVSQKRREAGQLGAARTWQKDGNSHGSEGHLPSDGTANANDADGNSSTVAMANAAGLPRHPIQSNPTHPEPSQEEPSPDPGVGVRGRGAGARSKRQQPAADPQASSDALTLHASLPLVEWNQWLEKRRRRRWPMDDTTLGKQLALLAQYDTATQRLILDTSYQCNWQGLFAPKSNGAHRVTPLRTRAKTLEELEAEEASRAAG